MNSRTILSPLFALVCCIAVSAQTSSDYPTSVSTSVVVRGSGLSVPNSDNGAAKSDKGALSLWRPTTNPAAGVRANAGEDETICLGNSLLLGGIPAGWGGTPPLLYQWTPTTSLNDPTSGNTPAKPTETTTYILKVTDATGESAYDTVVITVNKPPTPVITPSGKTSVCEGEKVTLSAPAGFSMYFWSNGEKQREITISSVSKSGRYTVTTFDGAGCTGTSDPINVTISPLPKPAISGSIDACIGALNWYLIVNESGTRYSWTVGGGGVIAAGTGTSSLGVQWSKEGTSMVAVTTTNAAGCSASAFFTVKVVKTTGTKLSAPAMPACEGDTLTLSSGEYNSFLWSTGDTTKDIRISKSGQYYFVAQTNNSGCTYISDTLSITFAPKPALPVVSRNGEELTAPAADRYQWLRNDVAIDGETNSSFQAKISGMYSVRVFNSAGCSRTSAPTEVIITSVIDPQTNSLWTLAPNPAGESITLSCIALTGRATIFDLQGREVSAVDRVMNGSHISIAALPAGMYVVQIRTAQTTTVLPFVKH